jgi:hypothetical protein
MRVVAQRIALAQISGWIHTPQKNNPNCWRHGDGRRVRTFHDLPNYLNDLDAIHQAEYAVWNDESLVVTYQETLKEIYVRSAGYQGAGYWFMAGAPLRAEAILKTLNLWENE